MRLLRGAASLSEKRAQTCPSLKNSTYTRRLLCLWVNPIPPTADGAIREGSQSSFSR
jgi:hypothetical protein